MACRTRHSPLTRAPPQDFKSASLSALPDARPFYSGYITHYFLTCAPYSPKDTTRQFLRCLTRNLRK